MSRFHWPPGLYAGDKTDGSTGASSDRHGLSFPKASASFTSRYDKVEMVNDGKIIYGVKPPASYNVEFWEGTEWRDAPAQQKSPPKPVGGQLNEVRFAKVKTAKVRVGANWPLG